jgi:hypothetical protein
MSARRPAGHVPEEREAKHQQANSVADTIQLVLDNLELIRK